MKKYSFLVVGLGNPGPEYECTRHNYGFMTIDGILSYDDKKTSQKISLRGDCLTYECQLVRSLSPLLLAKPLTYMNLSGIAVGKLAAHFGFTPEQIIVVHDDLDLPLGRMKFKKGGGDAGHNGIKSIANELKSSSIFRLRMGIGRPPAGILGKDFVLGKLNQEELSLANATISAAIQGFQIFFRRGQSIATERFNSFDGREIKDN